MQSWKALFLAGMLIGQVVGSSAALAESPAVSAEIEAIVDAAYDQWYDSLGVRQLCSAGVTIVFEAVDGRRGEYRTQSAEVVIDPYDSTSAMGAIVTHELSHHTFLACGAFADDAFTEAFYSLQDMPEDRGWFDYTAGWSAAPAEHFAEAMAIAAVGSGVGGISVGTETAALVSRWLAGAPFTPPAVSHDPVPYSSSTGLPEEDGIVETGETLPAGSEPVPTQELRELPVLYRSAVELVAHTSASVFSLTHSRVPRPV